MADRYWVGGTASWDGTAGTKWATTSGGAGGAAIPTSADDVFFDAASGVVTCTIATGNTGAKSITCTGFTGTITGTANISVAGSVTLVAGMAWTHTGVVTITGTGTLTTAGKQFSGLIVDGVGVTVTLGDALNTGTATITVTNGVFNTANYSVSSGSLLSSNSNVRTITLGSSTITLSNTITFTQTNLTFNANTSQITFTAGSLTFTTGAQTFYNVSFTSTSAATKTITGSAVFNNFTVTAPSSGVTEVSFDAPVTFNGTWSTTGTAGNQRVWFRSSVSNLSQTITVNSAPSLTDADFRNIYVIGTSAPISGTRIGDLGENTGITASTPKTVYWATAGGGNWSGNNWAASLGGAVSTDNFPLAQDTATISDTGLNTSATISLDSNIPYLGTITMATRTNAMTLSLLAGFSVYGDWTNGSGTTLSGVQTLSFSGRNKTQTITSGNKIFSGPLAIDARGSTVQLNGSLNLGSNNLSINSGVFDTKNYEITCFDFAATSKDVSAIKLGSSTVNVSDDFFIDTSNKALTFDAGTSNIYMLGASATLGVTGEANFYRIFRTYAAAGGGVLSYSGSFIYVDYLFYLEPTGAGVHSFALLQGLSIGTLVIGGVTGNCRVKIYNANPGTVTLNVGTLTALNCDFEDITISGTAAGTSVTRCGDLGGNSGITFPAPRTLYWNLAGSQNWSANGWATSSGGAPNSSNFPLVQDTAVFNNAGSAGTVTIDQNWNLGTVDMSARTTAMTLTTSTNQPSVYGNWIFGTGVTSSSTTGAVVFVTSGTQTITSNGITFGCPITINCTGTVNLSDALSIDSARTLTLTAGTFNAVSYNVTSGAVVFTGSASRTLKMGSGLWTLTGVGTVWNPGSTNLNFYIGTANITLSNTSTSARTFAGSSFIYNKLTIGGTTGTSTLTFSGSGNYFSELASVKTVAHTIALGTGQIFGKWTVTGTLGNVVTITGGASAISIAGAATSGINYLAMGSTGAGSTYGEFYAGPNSTGTAPAPVYRTAQPAPVTRYWRGGTGTWSSTSTTNWSATSGGAGGASVPRSHDTAIFNTSSSTANAAYTVTVSGSVRVGAVTMGGPGLNNNITWAGTGTLYLFGSFNLTAGSADCTRTFTGRIYLSGSTSGNTFNLNGVTLASDTYVVGQDCAWTLGAAVTNTRPLYVSLGSIDFSTYATSFLAISSNAASKRTISLGTGTTTLSSTSLTLDFGTTETAKANLTVNAGTSTISTTGLSAAIYGNGQTFYNLTTAGSGSASIYGDNTFNSVSIPYNAVISGNNTFTSASFNTTGGTSTSLTGNNTFVNTVSFPVTATLTGNNTFNDVSFAGTTTLTGDNTFGDVSFTGTSPITITLNGNNTFDNLSFTGVTSSGLKSILIGGTQTVAGTFTCSAGTNATMRHFVQSNSIGTTRTITCAAVALTDVDFRDITISGAAAPASGTRLGDCKGNSGITFGAGVNKYWNLAGNNNWSASGWATSSGGAVDVNNFPLAQDTCIFEASSPGSGETITFGISYNIGTVNMSARTSNTMTLATGGASPGIYGNWVNGSGTTISGTGALSFLGRGSQTITSAGVTFAPNLIFNSISGSVTLQDALTVSSATATNLTSGTFNANGFNVTLTSSFVSTSGSTRTLAIGSGTWTIAGSGTSWNVSSSGLTVTGTGTISLTSGSSKTFQGGDLTNYAGVTLNQGGAGTLAINNNLTLWDITNSYKTIGATTINFQSFTVILNQWTAAGESGRLLTITGTSLAAPGNLILSATNRPNVDFLSIFAIEAFGESPSLSLTNKWYAGDNSINLGSAGWMFLSIVPIVEFLNETISVESFFSSAGFFAATVEELVAVSESVVSELVITQSIAETVTVVDSLIPELVITQSIADTITLSDATTDSVIFSNALADTVSLADTLVPENVLTFALADTITVADSLDPSGSTFGLTLLDTITVADSLSTQTNYQGLNLADTVTVSDLLVNTLVITTSLADTVSLADTISPELVITVSFADTVSLADTVDPTGSTFGVTLFDTITGADSLATQTNYQGLALADTIELTDESIRRLLWEPIADTQNAGWTQIADTQSATWVQIADTQSATWVQIADTQSATWAQIADTQSANWTLINTE